MVYHDGRRHGIMATKDGGRTPRAVIHKRILEAAESDPEASLQALAGTIAGASPDLVERVVERYGDPGEAPADTSSTEEPTMSDQEPTSTAELTEKRRETLRGIAAAPGATQSELADALGVSQATVNRRLGDIDGFDWADRGAFVETVLDVEEASTADEAETDAAAVPGSEPTVEPAVDGGQLLDPDAEQAIEQLQERVARLERQLEASEEPDSALGDTALLLKVMRAVMADDDIDADEAVAILEALR